ncbi:MAG: CPBP family intramembrane glutamic endopeptidase [Pseudomonadota bacterium]
MPGLEEEVFYRGALLASLSLAFPIRWTVFGAETTPAFLLNSLLFGMLHGFWMTSSGLGFTAGAVLFSTVSGLVFSWLRERTGSLLLPIYMHIA